MEFLDRLYPKQPKPTAFSLIDVGRHTVKAVVVLMLPDNVEPQVIGYGRAETGGHDITGGRIEAGAVTRPVNTALTQAEDSTERFIGQKIVPDDVIFALAGRACQGELFTVKQKRSDPGEPINVKELENLRSRAERLVRQGLGREGSHWQPLAVTDAGLWLDDHLVLDGVGLTGRELRLALFGVAGQASALRALEVLANRLDLDMANIVAAPQALAGLIPHAEAIILDVGYSGTDVCLIKEYGLVAAAWTPFGGYFFSHALAQALEIELAVAEALKLEWARGDLAALEAEPVEQLLAGPGQRWYEAVMAILARFATEQTLPRRIYLTGGGSLLPGLERWLRADPVPFDCAPEVSWLGQQPLPALKDLTDGLDYNLFALVLSLTVGLPE